MRRDPGADLARAVAFTEAIAARSARDTVPFRWGRGFFDDTIPDVWDRNFLLLDEPDEDLAAQALVAEADRVMGARDLKHRQVVVNDDDLGAALAPGLAELGWEVTRVLWMVHRRAPDRPSETPVDEMAEEAHIAAKDEFNRRNPDVFNDDVVKQMRENARAVGRATDKRCFAAYAGDTVAAVCEIYSDGLTTQVEDVGTLEEYRDRGLARAVILRAVQEAQNRGHEMIFLCAEDDDWPKELYEKLGFDPVGHTYFFQLKPEQAASPG